MVTAGAARPGPVGRDGSGSVGEGRLETAHEQVVPAVIVVVAPPARELVNSLGHTQLGGPVGERPIAVIMVQPILVARVQDMQIEPAVAIVIAPRRPLGPALVDVRPPPPRRR